MELVGSKPLLEESSPVLEMEGRKLALLCIILELGGLPLLESRLAQVLVRVTGDVTPGAR